MNAAHLDEFYTFGDVYETLEACDELDTLLGRLRRQRLLSEQECTQSKQRVSDIRSQLEDYLNRARLLPRSPRLS